MNQLQANFEKLKSNPYPGRGIILGMTPDGTAMVQVYWIMGRSVNSRNRIFLEEMGQIRTKAFDESKLTDPSLIIYYPVRDFDGHHIVTNGDQTDTIHELLKSGHSFEEALRSRTYEPDASNYTPRISGIMHPAHSPYAYQLSILKCARQDGGVAVRNFFNYEKGIPGIGHCIHTYAGDGDPLPSYTGEPYELPLTGDPDDTADLYWNALNDENRVSLLVKYIALKDESTIIRIINRHK